MQLATWQILCGSFIAGGLISLVIKPRILAYAASLLLALLIACLPSCLQMNSSNHGDIDAFALISTIPASVLLGLFATYSGHFFFTRGSK